MSTFTVFKAFHSKDSKFLIIIDLCIIFDSNLIVRKKIKLNEVHMHAFYIMEY